MDVLQRTELERLSGVAGGPCVSVYLPTHAVGSESEQDAIRLKNHLQTVERKLTGNGMRAPTARLMLERASSLPNDPTWWQHRDRGLAIFMASDFFESYRLPIQFPELVTVADRFRIRPLIPLVNGHQQFYILQLSQNQVLLYSADEQSIERLDAKLPPNLREALNYDGADRGSQVHSASKADGGKQAAVFHGHGGRSDAAKDDLLSYCRIVDKAVTARLGKSGRPMLLACVDYLAPIYRKANSYDHLVEQTLSGNQEYAHSKELHQQALPLVRHELGESQVTKAIARYRELAGSSRVCDDMCALVSAASEGRIDVLLCDPRASVLGVHRADVGQVEVTGKEDDDDLVDLAAAETLKHRGDVYSTEGHTPPTASPAAAIFRY